MVYWAQALRATAQGCGGGSSYDGIHAQGPAQSRSHCTPQVVRRTAGAGPALLRAMGRNQRLRSLAANPFFLSVLLVGHEEHQEQPVCCTALYEGLLRILLEQENEASPFEPALKEEKQPSNA